MENKDWKKKLQEFEPEVDAKFWGNIAPQLPARSAFNWKIAASLLLLFCLGGITYYLSDLKEEGTSSKLVERVYSAEKQEDKNANSHNEKSGLPTPKRPIVEKAAEQSVAKKASKSGNELKSADQKIMTTSPIKIKTEVENKVTSWQEPKVEELTENQTPMRVSSETKALNYLMPFGFDQFLVAAAERKAPEGVIIPYIDSRDERVKDKPKKKKTDWSYYFQTQLFSSYHKIAPNLLDDKLITQIDNPSLSWDRVGYKLSAGINRQINPKWRVYAGLSSMYQSQTIHYTYVALNNEDVEVNTTHVTGEILIKPEKELLNESVFVENFSLGLQLGTAYKVVNRGRFYQEADIHVEQHFQLGDKAIYGNYQTYLNLAYNNMYQINDHFLLKVSPVISYTLKAYAQESNNSFDLKAYSVGLDFGLYFKF